MIDNVTLMHPFSTSSSWNLIYRLGISIKQHLSIYVYLNATSGFGYALSYKSSINTHRSWVLNYKEALQMIFKSHSKISKLLRLLRTGLTVICYQHVAHDYFPTVGIATFKTSSRQPSPFMCAAWQGRSKDTNTNFILFSLNRIEMG